MPRERVALKVKIGLKGADWPNVKERGHALYPDFNQLQAVINSGMDWSVYVDKNGEAWHYDKKCGHKDHEDGSPCGMQWGMLIVPRDFAEQAVASFAETCTIIDETELEAFWDNRAHAHEPEETVDDIVMRGIAANQQIGRELSPGQQRALDPEDDTPGIRRNYKRYWRDYKSKKGITIVQ